jgi:hypothetical protein
LLVLLAGWIARQRGPLLSAKRRFLCGLSPNRTAIERILPAFMATIEPYLPSLLQTCQSVSKSAAEPLPGHTMRNHIIQTYY